jgi:hypothetical protein
MLTRPETVRHGPRRRIRRKISNLEGLHKSNYREVIGGASGASVVKSGLTLSAVMLEDALSDTHQ